MNIQSINALGFEIEHHPIQFGSRIWEISVLCKGQECMPELVFANTVSNRNKGDAVELNYFCFEQNGTLRWHGEPPIYRYVKNRGGDDLDNTSLSNKGPRFLEVWNGNHSFIISPNTGRLLKRLTVPIMDWNMPAPPEKQFGDDNTPYDMRTVSERVQDLPEKWVMPTLGPPQETLETAVLCKPNERVDIVRVSQVWFNDKIRIHVFNSMADGHQTKNFHEVTFGGGLNCISLVRDRVILLGKSNDDELTLNNQVTFCTTFVKQFAFQLEDPRGAHLANDTHSVWKEFQQVENEPNQAIGVMTGGEHFKIDLKTGHIIMKC